MKSISFLMKKYRLRRKHSLLPGLLIILCLGVSVGYAFLTTTLSVTGAAHVASSRWDVHFENVQIKEGSVPATTAPTIVNDTSISFATVLENPGDFYEFTVDVVNDGTYNAIIDSLEISPTLTEEESKFFQYEVIWDDGISVAENFPILAGTSKTMKIKFQYLTQEDSSLLPDEDKDFSCEITLNFSQDSTKYQPEKSVLHVREDSKAFWSYKNKIINIVFSDVIYPPENVIQEWDVSENNDGNVMAYLVMNNSENNYYDLYLQGNGHLYANPDSSNLFKDFYYLENLVNLKLLDTSNVTNMDYMFSWAAYYSESFHINFNQFDTSNVTSMINMFETTCYKCHSFTIDLGNQFDTSKVTNMSNMFKNAGHWSQDFTINLGEKFDTSNVTNMSSMFQTLDYEGGSPYFTLDLGDKFDTSKVINMSNMFSYCGSRSQNFTLRLGDKFNTSNVTDMSYMFANTGADSTVLTIDLGNKFDTSKVTNMSNMFYNCGAQNQNFTLNLGDKFNTSNVTDMSSMFYNTGSANNIFSLDLSTFDFSNVTSYRSIFDGMYSSNTIYTKDISSRDWIVNNSGNRYLTTSNVLVKS